MWLILNRTVSPLLDRQPTAQKWLENNFCPVLASLLLKSSIPSHETCKNLEATQISFHSSTRTIHRLLTPAALKQLYPHPHSTQKSPLPIKATYSMDETPSECRHFHTDDRSRQPVTAPNVRMFLRLHLSNQKQELLSQPYSYMIPAFSIIHNVTVFSEMLFCFATCCVFSVASFVCLRNAAEFCGVSSFVKCCRVLWHVVVFCESLQCFVKYSCVFFPSCCRVFDLQGNRTFF